MNFAAARYTIVSETGMGCSQGQRTTQDVQQPWSIRQSWLINHEARRLAGTQTAPPLPCRVCPRTGSAPERAEVETPDQPAAPVGPRHRGPPFRAVECDRRED